jgi:hypothetical protein
MSSLQATLIHYHETEVQLADADENAILRGKRDIVLDRLERQGLRFDRFNQGSYAMGTGVQPIDGDYDIDVGLIFADAGDLGPKQLKRRVFDAAQWPNQRVEWHRSCVRVQWVQQGAPRLHVDLAVYRPAGALLDLAVGKEHARAEETGYLRSDPKGFIQRVKEYGTPESRVQLRRVVRLLKRWKDLQFPAEGNARPVGVAFTAYALAHLRPSPQDDAAALGDLVNRMLGEASWGRIRAPLPVPPGTDTFARMTDEQMRQLAQRLAVLKSSLERARAGDARPLFQQLGVR